MTNCLKSKRNGFYFQFLICFISMLLLSTAMAADKTPPVLNGPDAGDRSTDLLQVYRLALKNDPTFQSERYRYETSPEILKQAQSGLMPSIGLGAYYSRSRQETHDTTIAVFGETEAEYPSKGFNLRLSQPIFEYSSIKRVLQAKEEVKQAEFEFEVAKQDLILRVAEAYIEALASHDNLEFTRAEEQGLKFHFELAKERYNSGLAPVMDFHDAKARYAYVTAKRVKAEYWLDDALEALAEITGERIDKLARLRFKPAAEGDDRYRASKIQGGEKMAPETLPGTLPLIKPDPDNIKDWIDAAYKQNLQIQIREQGVQIARQEVDRQKAGHYPTLELVARVVRDDVGGSLYGGSSDVGKQEALVQMNIPIYEGGRVSSKTREALKQYAAAKEELKKVRRAVKRETMAAFLGVKGSIKNTVALNQSVVSTRIALKAKREGYKAGLFPSLVVSDAERDHYLAKRDFAKAQYEYIRNSLRLKKVVSTLNETDLAEINQWLK